jgi:hypothetical protein
MLERTEYEPACVDAKKKGLPPPRKPRGCKMVQIPKLQFDYDRVHRHPLRSRRHLLPMQPGIIFRIRIVREVTLLYNTKHARLSTGDTVPVDVVVVGTAGRKLDCSLLDQETVLNYKVG